MRVRSYAAIITAMLLSFVESSTAQGTCEATLSTLAWGLDSCGSQEFEFGGCCGNSLNYTYTADSTDPICSTAIMQSAYCANQDDGCTDFTPNSSHTLEMEIAFTYPDVNDTCCRKCKCYGDPLCEAFNGSTNQLIECDARNSTTCRMEQSICRQQYDHAGNRCKWLKGNLNYPWWRNNLEDGSPCQADYSVSGQLELLLINTSGLVMSTLIGERGVQTDFSIQLSDDSEPYTINSDDCFNYDPRDVGNSDAAAAWSFPSSVSSLPSTWSVSTPNDVEIRWHIGDASIGIYADVICNKAVGATRTRLDIQNITDTRITADSVGDGYCFTNIIPSGDLSGTNVADTVSLHKKCLSASLSDLTYTCKALSDCSCYKRTVLDWQQYWCESAELVNTQAYSADVTYAEVVATCLTDLRNGKASEQSMTWIEYACQMNSGLSYGSSSQNSYVAECVNILEENGWSVWEEAYESIVFHQWDIADVPCATSWDDYATNIPDDLTCATGVIVEADVDGDWTPVFYIPPDKPLCSDVSTIITGEDFPILFQYRVRFRQCGLGAECLVADDGSNCKPLSTVSGNINFGGNVCPQGNITCNVCSYDDTSINFPSICTSNEMENFTLGSCDSCCSTNNFAVGEEGQTCRNLTITAPYCNASDSELSTVCGNLISTTSNASLTLRFSEESTNTTSCCETCMLWGDPFGQGFDGSRDKLIVCDARDSNCWPTEKICTGLKDFAGNDCIWNQTVQDLIGKNRASIGAYGSPCLPNWSESGEAIIVLYSVNSSTAFYNISFATGERSILDMMYLETQSGNYTLDPVACFEDTTDYPGWHTINGIDFADAFDVTFIDGDEGYGSDERAYAVRDPTTGILIRLTCVNSVSNDDAEFVGGYRLNVEYLVDVNTERGDDVVSGYCVSGDLLSYGGEYTENSMAEECEVNSLSLAHLACKAFWSGACTTEQIPLGIENWCKTANQPNTVQACINQITKKTEKKTGEAWIEAVCTALLPMKGDETKDDFIDDCIALVDDSEGDPYSIVEKFKSVGDFGSGRSFCSSSVDDYSMREDTDPCTNGISVQYEDSTDGWTELFFIPSTLMPCNGTLEVPANMEKYHPLFVNPIRFLQCDLDNSESGCPAESNIEATCMSNFGFSIEYAFTYSDDLGCPTSS